MHPRRLLRRFVDVVLEHRLADLEALILLDTLRRWPVEAFGCATIIRLDAGDVGRRLRVCSVAVHNAVERLARKRLVGKELIRGRLHVRLTTALLMIATSEETEGTLTLHDAQAAAVSAGQSQGRDRVLLLVLLSMAEPGEPVVHVPVQGLGEIMGMPRQSVSRIVRRLVARGAVTRVRGGLLVHALAAEAAATSR